MARTRATAKKAGSTFERLFADHAAWRLRNDNIDRRPKTGTKDRGDIGGIKSAFGERIVVEAKDTVRVDLGNWQREVEVEKTNDNAPIGVILHKRHGKSAAGEQWVTMKVDDFLRLVGGPREDEL